MLGVKTSWEYVGRDCTLEAGDIVLLYTDGAVETTNTFGEQFGEQRLIEEMERCRHLNASELCERLRHSIASFNSGLFRDDVALMAIRAL